MSIPVHAIVTGVLPSKASTAGDNQAVPFSCFRFGGRMPAMRGREREVKEESLPRCVVLYHAEGVFLFKGCFSYAGTFSAKRVLFPNEETAARKGRPFNFLEGEGLFAGKSMAQRGVMSRVSFGVSPYYWHQPVTDSTVGAIRCLWLFSPHMQVILPKTVSTRKPPFFSL